MYDAARTVALSGVLILWVGCSSTTQGAGTPTASAECRTDFDCGSSTSSCKQVQCINQACEESDTPASVDAQEFVGREPACKRVVCDGHGGEQSVADPTSLPTGSASACMRVTCDAAGNATTAPDPTNVPVDQPHDCQREKCSSSGIPTLEPDANDTPIDTPNDCKVDSCTDAGGPTQSPNPSDTPLDQKGDCHKDSCNTDGTIGKINDDNDVPAPSTCMTYTCNSGNAVGAAANIGNVCSSLGFACGTTGQCDTCRAPDAACTEPGVGSRSAAAPYDFQGIGRCDSGGRAFCGDVPTGQGDYYTYYDDGTGPLCSFDPYIEILPAAPVTFCAYVDCAAVGCPSGSTPDTSAAGKPGCCVNAAPGSFTGMAVSYCGGGRVTLKVTSTAACAGYEIHFHN